MGGVLTGATSIGSGFLGNIVGGIGGGIAEGAGAINRYSAGTPYSNEDFRTMLDHQKQIYDQQQNLAQALLLQSQGQGPNPAQTQFQMNEQANIANAQGLIASQRGLNPALAARLGSNAATSTNNQSALGSALIQQQQQLAATANLGNLYGQLQQGNEAEQNRYTQANLEASKINSGVAGSNAQIRGQTAGGLLNALGGIGGAAAGAKKAAKGGVIAGTPSKGPDSESNDTVPIMAQPGEIIIPNSKSHDPEKAKEFIDHLLKSKSKSKKSKGYGDVLEARRKRKAA